MLFFKARAKRPYLSDTGRASNAEKQPTGPGPEHGDENGPAAALLVGHVSIQICSLHPPVRLGPPCRRPILIATKYLVFRGQDTRAFTPDTGWKLMLHCSSIRRAMSSGLSIAPIEQCLQDNR